MGTPRVVNLGRDRRMIDLDFRDAEGLVAAYLAPQEGGWTLIETGPSSCRDALVRGLQRAGVEPERVLRVFVTHIHLDHAGGLGAVAETFPKAELYAHELGIPHLADPSRLVASARRAWGPASDALWGPIVPAPRERLRPLRGGEAFAVAGGELKVIATPGHAKHHLAYFDTAFGGLFTGDAAGVRLEGASRARPAVPPPDLDLEALYASVEAMRQLKPAHVCYTHFGPSPDGLRDLEGYREIVEEWRRIALAAARERPDPEFVAAKLAEHDSGGPAASARERASLVSGYELAAQGFLRYFATHGEIGGAPG